MPSSAPARSRPAPWSGETRPPRRSRWATLLRVLLPALLIVGWLAVAGVGGPFFGKISEVSTNDQSSFLPESTESTRVTDLQGQFRDSDAIPAIVLLVREGGLEPADRAWAEETVASVQDSGPVEGRLSPPIPSEDGEALQVVVPLPDGEVVEDVEALSERFAQDRPEGLQAYVTGPAGFTADLVAGFEGIDGLLLGVALAVVFVILLVVYRSPVLPVLVLLTSVFALSAAILVVYWLAANDLVTISGQVQGILFILVVGAATDYSLLYTARYRDALLHHRGRAEATRAALKGSVEPIVASGATVIAGLLCLLLSDLASNQALGPVASVGIVMSILAALSFLPAVLYATGRGAFWPFRPRFDASGAERVRVVGHGAGHRPTVEGRGVWASVARFVARAPRAIWVVTTAVLLVLAGFSTQFQATGVEQSELVLGESQARDGQEALAEHFPGGSGSPAVVLVPTGSLDAAVTAIEDTAGVADVSAVANDSPSGTLPLGENAAPPVGPFAGVEPTEAEGLYQLQATLADAADSPAAEQTVRELRENLAAVDEEILVGGTTATNLDTNETSIADRTLIIPVILVVITLILMLLLRSVLAPVLLILTTVVSFFSALGVAALVFEHVLGLPGADPSVPLFGFVFLVALGIDYNIFLMSRVREESLVHGTRAGILRGLTLTGGVITSAGIVLAATFAALAVIPIMFLVQLAFIVAFGVLLDALIVRSLLVPALTYDIGRAIWWPAHRRIDL
ncbi:MMPL family transporter [Kocuria turfanensis]|uniref:RND superfamily drug exporter n=1 Tax=Kocuria turfanensis TaxID=388357 RepID=A0A512ID15_9MICC|nr:efflux RND transporter permease subunit [Kocuria turfanensis]GEO95595.1 RND superfamily drug exporter [Kocuria turfanensis]